MKRYDIFSDCHRKGVDPKNVEFTYTPNTVFLGDNHEFKNIDKDDIVWAEIDYFKHVKRARKAGAAELVGNHEVNMSEGALFHIAEGILFIHGHRALWSDKKVKKWETREPGQSKPGRFFSKIFSKARHVFPKRKISKRQLKKLEKYANKIQWTAKEPIHTIVFGHTHPSSLIEKEYNGRKYINVMRGKTTLWI